jgi:hypothetical protein
MRIVVAITAAPGAAASGVVQHENARGDPFRLADDLLPRAADVTLKKRRSLGLFARETPADAAHREN